jgi:hypothetical protein
VRASKDPSPVSHQHDVSDGIGRMQWVRDPTEKTHRFGGGGGNDPKAALTRAQAKIT